MAPDDTLGLRRRVVRFLFLVPALFLASGGIFLVGYATEWHMNEVLRDLGIAMLIAGTVGLVVELLSRGEMEKVLGELIDRELVQATDGRFSGLEDSLSSLDRQARTDTQDLRQRHEAVFPRLEGLYDLVERKSGLLEVGLRRLSLHRDEKLLLDVIERAEPGNSIRVLALCLNTLANNRGHDLLKDKLREGCRIRLLLLDPNEEAVLEERARQENKTTPEDILEFKDRVQMWDSVHKRMVQKLIGDKTLPGSIELGYYQSLPSCFLVDNGESMAVGLYLHGCRGEQCPHLEIENKVNGLYQQFGQHFETLWARKVLPFDRRHKDEPVEEERRALRLA